MITLQHTLATLLALNGDEEELRAEIPYVLLPDAIRRYLGPRQYSHFEVSRDGEDVSWLKYPEDIKGMTKESLMGAEKHIVEDIKPCVLGEETVISAFDDHNDHLSPIYYAGVKKHLTQDFIFDAFVRENIDCSHMYQDKFIFKGQEYDGKGIRKVIADFEAYGLYLLAYMIYDSYGITTNQDWFDRNVKTQLDVHYSEDLANGTYGYMRIPEEINKWITEHDWSHLSECSLTNADYLNMYQAVIDSMQVVDFERAVREQEFEDAAESQKNNNGTPTGPNGPGNGE